MIEGKKTFACIYMIFKQNKRLKKFKIAWTSEDLITTWIKHETSGRNKIQAFLLLYMVKKHELAYKIVKILKKKSRAWLRRLIKRRLKQKWLLLSRQQLEMERLKFEGNKRIIPFSIPWDFSPIVELRIEDIPSYHVYDKTCGWCGITMEPFRIHHEPMHGDACCSGEHSEILDNWGYQNIILKGEEEETW
jgi:hypothetical protein